MGKVQLSDLLKELNELTQKNTVLLLDIISIILVAAALSVPF